ncbi:MAG: S1/P1 nuclease [Stellaceae bacterium]
MKLLGAAVLLLIVGTPSDALAWGPEGHRIVAEIAEQYLEPETVRQVRGLHAIENATTLAQVSTSATSGATRRRWHFVNIAIQRSGHAGRLRRGAPLPETVDPPRQPAPAEAKRSMLPPRSSLRSASW